VWAKISLEACNMDRKREPYGMHNSLHWRGQHKLYLSGVGGTNTQQSLRRESGKVSNFSCLQNQEWVRGSTNA